jgi:hypothetical protein
MDSVYTARENLSKNREPNSLFLYTKQGVWLAG